jgi:hypothetical protein
MATNHEPTAKAEATSKNPKGIRKVDLSELAGELSQRGRSRYEDPELHEALLAMIADREPIAWDTAVVKGNSETEIEASKAMWRNRASSVFATIDTDMEITIRWTKSNLMVIQPRK